MEVELTIIEQHSTETRIILRSLPAILGRHENADVPLRDPWASHRHCELNERNGALMVRDLGSKNGIFLHGHRVIESSLLPGDCITIGGTKITVYYQPGAPTDAVSPVHGRAVESGDHPPQYRTPPLSDPETRDLLYGVAGNRSRSRLSPEEAPNRGGPGV